jgi:hypothetical protein
MFSSCIYQGPNLLKEIDACDSNDTLANLTATTKDRIKQERTPLTTEDESILKTHIFYIVNKRISF